MTARSSPAASSARYPRSTRTHKTPTASTAQPQVTTSAQIPSLEEPQPQQHRPVREPHQAHAPPQHAPPQHALNNNDASMSSLHTPATQQWREHSDHHFVVRKQMIARLQRLHPLLSTNSSMRHAGHLTRIPELVQRLELMLYKAANSLEEYLNVCTLERRVHSLVTMLEPLPPLPSNSEKPQLKSAGRKRRVNGSPSTPLKSKRQRRTSVSVPSIETTACTTLSRLESDLNSDLLSHVFSYNDGIDTLRSCSLVSRFFHTEAPRLVSSLRIDVGNKTHAALLHGRVSKVLAKCTNLRSLTITNSRNNASKKNGFTRAFHGNNNSETADETSDALPDMEATPASFMAATNPQLFTGRVLFHELSELFYAADGAVFPKLTTLALVAPFDCANEAESTLAFLHAFASNLTQTTHLNLQKLVLDTTVLGDRRLPRLFALFHAFPRVFQQQLRVLELSNNFIGEAGMRVLCSSLASKPWTKLEKLNLRRNILTDGDALHLAHILEPSNSTTTSLQRVDVSENFIGKPGFQALARTANASHVAVQSALNCMETGEAAQLFM